MKKVVVLTFLLSVGWIINCSLWEPAPPELIVPEEGAVFTSNPPAFVWAANKNIDTCQLFILTDSTLGSVTIDGGVSYDTFHSFPKDLFDCLPSGTYYWRVGFSYGDQKIWSQRSFKIEHELPELDLDTTYFPLGLHYKWVFDDYDWLHDTNSVEVINIINEGDQITYYISVTNSINVQLLYFLPNKVIRIGNILYLDHSDRSDYFGYIQIVHLTGTEDTLHLGNGNSGFIDGYGPWYSLIYAECIKGLGIIHQQREFVCETGGGDNFEDSLLYFIKGADTVWRCPECP